MTTSSSFFASHDGRQDTANMEIPRFSNPEPPSADK
jgi:hypothetical protein